MTLRGHHGVMLGKNTFPVNGRIEARAIVLPGGSSISSFMTQAANGSNTFTFPGQTATANGVFLALAHWRDNNNGSETVGCSGTGITAKSPTTSNIAGQNGIRTALGADAVSTSNAKSGSLNRINDTSPPGSQVGQTVSFFVNGATVGATTGTANSTSGLSKTLTLPSSSIGDLILVATMSRNKVPYIAAGFALITSVWFATGNSTFPRQYLSIFTKIAESGDSGAVLPISMGGASELAPLFVLAGQSNARGFGSTTGTLPASLTGAMSRCWIWNTHTSAFENYEATVNSDTVTSGATTPQAWGAEAEFCRQWAAQNAGDVYLVKMGVDSSPLSDESADPCWLPSAGELYADLSGHISDAVAALNSLSKTASLEAVLYMQGEEDAEDASEAADYEDNLNEFIAAIRADFGSPQTKVILGRVLDRRTYSSVVRAAQAQVASDDAFVEIVDTDAYPQTSDERHYTAQGLVAFGSDLFASYTGVYPAQEIAAPTFADVKLLAGFNGSNGATTYTEESTSARVATFAGNAQLSTADAIYGSAALLFDGTGDYLTFPDSADFHFGSGPFAIQFSVEFNSVAASTTALINQWNSGSNQKSWAIDRPTASTLQFAYSTNGSTTVSALSVPFYPVVGQIYKFLFERDSSNVLRIFQDGALLGKVSLSATLFNSTQTVRLGGLVGFSGYDLSGVLDEVRIVKAQIHGSDARFSPNAAEFPRS